MSTKKVQSASTPVAGGEYLAERNADGTWNIYDVPIFSAHERFGFSFDRAWQEKAVASHQALYAQPGGYCAPVHVHHHDPFPGPQVGVKRAGFYLPKRVEDRSYPWSDTPVATTIADLLNVEHSAYQEIASGKLPYLSVEIRGEEFDPEKAAFNGLALLPHEAPYFRFPLLTVGAELTQDEAAKPQSLAASAPSVAFYSAPGASGASGAHFKLGGIVKTTSKPAAFSAATLDPAKLADVVSKAVSASLVAFLSPAETPAEDPEGEDKKPDATTAPAAVTPTLGPAEVPQAAPAPQALVASAPTHALELRLKVLEGELAVAKREKALASCVDAAAAEVQGYGAGSWRQELVAAYAAGGEPAVKNAVSIIKAGATPRPPESFTGDLPSPNEAPEVAAYAMAGQAKQREARRMAYMYENSPAWVRSGTTLGAYIATQIGPPPAASNAAPAARS